MEIMTTKGGKRQTLRVVRDRSEAIPVDGECKNAGREEYTRMVIQDAMSVSERRKWEIMNFETRDRRTNRSLVMASTLHWHA